MFLLSTKSVRFSGMRKKSGEWTVSRKKTRQKERETWAEKIERGDIKRNKMTTLRFHAGERHRTSVASLQGSVYRTTQRGRSKLGFLRPVNQNVNNYQGDCTKKEQFVNSHSVSEAFKVSSATKSPSRSR